MDGLSTFVRDDQQGLQMSFDNDGITCVYYIDFSLTYKPEKSETPAIIG
jgi:hypothetical protein